MRPLVVVLTFGLAACGHIPKADPNGVPPPWPASPAPLRESPPPPAETRPRDHEKPVVPPLKHEVLPPSEPPRS